MARHVNNAFLCNIDWDLCWESHHLWVEVVREKYNCGHDILPLIKMKQGMTDDTFSVRSTYNELLCIMINHRRWRMGVVEFSTCPLCHNHDETILYIERLPHWSNHMATATSSFDTGFSIQPLSTGLISRLCWIPPNLGWIKVNIDVALRLSDQHVACGGVIRNHRGKFIYCFMHSLGRCFIVSMELWAIFHGLKLALDQGLILLS
ncbi:putative ribonuclease H protein [Glycine soja]